MMVKSDNFHWKILAYTQSCIVKLKKIDKNDVKFNPSITDISYAGMALIQLKLLKWKM